MSSMEVQKRKRVNDEKPRDGDGGLKRVAPPPDEEVEEFFAIVKRIRIALKYFQRRDGAEKPTWSPTFQREDFDGVKTDPECSRKTGLDLNSNPVSDGSDSVQGQVVINDLHSCSMLMHHHWLKAKLVSCHRALEKGQENRSLKLSRPHVDTIVFYECGCGS